MSRIQFPEEIQQCITNEFLSTLKVNLDVMLSKELDNLRNNLHKQPTFWNFYQWFDNSNGFNKALKIACKSHDLMELYTYRESMELDENEMLGGIIIMMLFEQGIIKEGDYDDAMPCPILIE